MKKIYLPAIFALFYFSADAQVLWSEFFNSSTGTTPPSNWSNTDLNSSGILWNFSNPGNRILTAPISGNAAIFDDIYFNQDSSPEDAVLVSRVIDASVVTGSLVLEFDHLLYAFTGSTAVGSVEVWDGTSWNEVLSFGGENATYGTRHESLDITTAAGGSSSAKVRFHWIGLGYYWIVDNVVVSQNTCITPSALNIVNITGYTADLSWQAGSTETDWDISCVAAGAPPGVGTMAISFAATGTPTYMLDGLQNNADYDVYVRSNCGGTSRSAWSTPYSFTAHCSTPAVSNYPWLENFDNSCGQVIENTNGDNKKWEISAFEPYSPAYSLHISQSATLAMNDWYHSQALILTAGVTYQLGLKYKNGLGGNSPEKLTIYLIDDQVSTALTRDLLLNLSSITNDTYETATANFTPPATGIYYLGFHGHSDTGTSYIAVDDISVMECPGCQLTTSLGEEALLGIDLYPNPTNGVLHVTLPAANGTMSVSVIDFAGQEVLIMPNAAQESFDLDLSRLDNGVYFVKFLSESIQQTQRIVVTN